MPALDPDEIVTYAKGIAAALRVIGPTPRDRALGMLRGLDLSEQDAITVLDYALARGILVEGEGAGHLCSPPQRRHAAATAIVSPRSPRRPARRSRAAAHAAGYVLVIEDDDVLRGAMLEALTAEGHRVETAAHRAHALDVLASEGRPSVVVVANVMSVVDGVELVQRLRAVTACAALPVIAVSAMPAHHPPPGTAFLTEPLTAATLVREVRRILGSRGGHALVAAT